MYDEIKKLYNVYKSAYDEKPQMRYLPPKIYIAKKDLKKRWYVYYSVEDPKTDKMVRQPYISMGVNR